MAAVNTASLSDRPTRPVPSIEDDPIPSLLITPFLHRNNEEQNTILQNGKPIPLLNIFKKIKLKPKNKKGSKDKPKCNKYRLSWWYNKFEWLSASIVNEALYCWPCLLYSEKKNIWSLAGEICPEYLSKVLRAHDMASSHQHCFESFTNARTLIIKGYFKEVMTAAALKQRNKVTRNRELMSRFIDILMMLYQQDFLFQYVDTKIKFLRLFHLISQNDDNGLLKHCSELGDKFSKFMQWFFVDMFNCLHLELQFYVSGDLIENEPHPFWSLQVDCMNNMNDGKQHNSLMVRFIDINGDLQENHLGFYVKKRPILAKNLFEYLITTTSEIANIEYLVAQSYDGGCITDDHLIPLCKQIRSVASGAVLVPSTDHALGIVLLQGVLNSCDIKQFVFVLQDFLIYENNVFLYKLLKFPESEHKYMKLNSQLLNHIRNEGNNFVTSYKEQKFCMRATPHMLCKVDYFCRNLQDVKFVSLLLLFIEIFTLAEKFCDEIDEICTNFKLYLFCVTTVLESVELISIQELISDSYFYVTGSRVFNSNDSKHIQLVNLHNSVVKNITKQLLARYDASCRRLPFLSLVDSKQFESHNINFPDYAFSSLEHFYGKHFKMDWLQNELKLFIYCDKQFYSLNPLQILNFLIKNEMTEFLPQSYKLFCLVATLPIWPRDVSKGSCIERTIKFFNESRTSTHEVLRSQLSNVFIDKPTVLQITSMDPFHYDIIERFADEVNDSELSLEYDS